MEQTFAGQMEAKNADRLTVHERDIEAETETRTPDRKTPLISAEELSALGDITTPFLVSNLIPTVGLVVMSGDAKAGKTWVALDLSLAVSQGRELFGRYPSVAARVLYINQDMEANVFGKRFNQMCVGKEMERSNSNFLSTSGLRLNLANKDSVAALERIIEEARPKLVVIDTLSASCDYDEQRGRQVTSIFKDLKEMARRQDVAILIVDHNGKRSRKLIGHGAKLAFSEVILGVRRLGNGRSIFEVVNNRHHSNEGDSVELQLTIDESKAVLEVVPDDQRTNIYGVWENNANGPDEAVIVIRSLSEETWKSRQEIQELSAANGVSVKDMDKVLLDLFEGGRVEKMKDPNSKGRGNKPHLYKLKRQEMEVAA